MKIVLYPFFAITSWLMSITAILFAEVIALFVDANGNLPKWLSWLQTPDAPCWGAPFWKEQHPGYSTYLLCASWLRRNPAQGFDQHLKADVTMQTPIKVWWRKGDNYLYTCDNAFHLSYRLGLATGGFGWRLNNIVEGYPHPTMGQIVCTPIRFHK